MYRRERGREGEGERERIITEQSFPASWLVFSAQLVATATADCIEHISELAGRVGPLSPVPGAPPLANLFLS